MSTPAFATTLRSPIPEASDPAWAAFASAMATHPLSAVSGSGNLGAFQMPLRRMAELGLVHDAAPGRTGRRMRWAGDFAPPMTRERFLADPAVQCVTFAASIKDYAAKLRSGELRQPEGAGLAPALAVLHRAGRGGLDGKILPATAALVARVRGIF